MSDEELIRDQIHEEKHSALRELAKLKAERDALREALAQCVRRLDTLNTGGPDEPDPTVVRARKALAKGKA